MSEDIIEQMEREPGTRPVCAALTGPQLKALRLGRVTIPTMRALAARRLLCPAGVATFKPTPMGAQWRQTLIEHDRMRRALRRAQALLNDGGGRQDVLDAIAGGLW